MNITADKIIHVILLLNIRHLFKYCSSVPYEPVSVS